MVLIDSSVWIDYFNGQSSRETDYLDRLLGNDVAATGDVILVEVLQGFRADADYASARQALSGLPAYDMLGLRRSERAAGRYRRLRKSGVTVRKTIDVIIGSFCIDEGLPLLFSDRDFLPMVEHLGLQPACAGPS
ncbi:MAG: PIN domain nuclease [Gammaproteobacteria bacterium]|nr:PIN domain nuclease [Gammaproteobacteria bacterium]